MHCLHVNRTLVHPDTIYTLDETIKTPEVMAGLGPKKMLFGIACGLDYIHRAGIVHRSMVKLFFNLISV